jgi:chromosome partitioning protein
VSRDDNEEPLLVAKTTAEQSKTWQQMRSANDELLNDLPSRGQEPTVASQPKPAATARTLAAPDQMEPQHPAEYDTPIMRQAQNAIQVQAQGRGGLPAPARTRVLVVANQKGGVGKTTSAVNLAASLAMCGLRVLVIDLDPQGNASTALGIDRRSEDLNSIYEALIGDGTLDDVVRPVDGYTSLHCAPATIDLAGSEIELVTMDDRESRLRRVLGEHLELSNGERRYDYVFIDCPPSLGLLTVNALVAGDEVLIPIQCEYYALEGLSQLLQNIKLVKSHLNRGLEITTVLLTMFDGRTRLSAQVVDEVRAYFGETALKTTIPRSVRISEAPSYGQTVLSYDPGSTGAMSYMDAAREMAVRTIDDAGERVNEALEVTK